MRIDMNELIYVNEIVNNIKQKHKNRKKLQIYRKKAKLNELYKNKRRLVIEKNHT